MARLTKRLTALTVKNLNSPGRHPDGNGLYLLVGPTGAKSWVLMYKLAGKRVELGLGSTQVLSLNQARERAQEAAQMRANGIDPRSIWRAAAINDDTPAFGAVATDYVDSQEVGWKNAKHRQQWRNTLWTYAAPIWDKPINAITVEDVLGIVQPIWLDKAVTAKRVRGRIERVLDAAKVRGLRDGENPAAFRGNLAMLLPKQRKDAMRHHKAMAYADIPAFMVALRKCKGSSARALELTIQTALRTSEVLCATWSEVDLDQKLWTIPAERMKAGKEHRVPLSDAAITLLEALPRTSAFLFPSASDRKKPLSNMAMTMVLQRLKLRQTCTVHGFRSTFRDWVHEETEHPREIAEQALAHQVGSEVERAYRRGDAIEKRRQLMADWSTHLG